MKLTFLGGADEVGASCTLIEIGGHRLVVDCGIRMGGRDALPWLQAIEDAGGAELILLTHAHMDHSGALPVLVQTSRVPIVMTPPTKDLVRVLLLDSLKIMAIKAEEEGEIPIYPKIAVQAVLDLADMIEWGETRSFFGGDINVTYIPAGHIMGASSVLIESEEGSVLMSGDISGTPQLTVGGFDWSMLKKGSIDVLVTESTYGNRTHASRTGEERRLIAQIKKVVERGGSFLIPAFALGRAQEVILLLARAFESGDLEPVPVYVDGMVRQICGVYWEHADMYGTRWLRHRTRTKGNLFFSNDNIHGIKEPSMRNEVARMRPVVIISSSGMLTGGPSAFYAKHFAKDPRCHIAITGYQDEESPGRAMQEAARGQRTHLNLGGEEVELLCSVGTYSLSAHADATEIVGALSALRPRHVCLVHGDRGAREQLRDALKHCGVHSVRRPALGEGIDFGRGHARSMGNAKDESEADKRDLDDKEYVSKPLQAQDLRLLAERLFQRDKGGRGYAARQLMEEWGDTAGARDPQERNRVLELLRSKESPFKSKKGRHHIRHHTGKVVGGWDPDKVKVCNQNNIAAAVREAFPPEAGLYKVGAFVPRRTLRLMFHFPTAALEKYAAEIESVRAEWGWDIEINDAPHQGKLVELAVALCPPGVSFKGSPSIHLDKNRVSLKVTSFTANEESIAAAKKEFLAVSGFALDFVRKVTPVQADLQGGAGSSEGKQEVNLARGFAIHSLEAVSCKPHKVSFKKGLMVLAFITPEIGARCSETIQQIIDKTGWEIGVHPHPNQHALFVVAHELIGDEYHLKLSAKNDQRVVEVKINGAMDFKRRNQITEEYFERTAWRLHFLR